MITDREKFLMLQWGNAKDFYPTLDEWLNEVITDAGHTVEQNLSYDADIHALKLKEVIN